MRVLIILSIFIATASLADERPEIDWSVAFNPTNSSDVVGAVAYSKTEPNIVYFAGVGTANAITRDANGNRVPEFPYTRILPNTLPTPYPNLGRGLFVAKMNYITNEIVFFTFVMSEPKRIDSVSGMAFDEVGNIYVVGNLVNRVENTSELPKVGNMVGCRTSSATGSSWDGVFVKLNPNASDILSSCFYGTAGDDKIHGIGVFSDGEYVLVGETDSPDFGVNNEIQSALNGVDDGFFARFVNNGSLLIGSYYGGSGGDALLDVTITDSGRVLAAGGTTSTDFPTTTDAFRTFNSGAIDGILIELDVEPGGDPRVVTYSTYFGGSGNEAAQKVTADASGNVYIVGTSNSTDYPTLGAGSSAPSNAIGAVVTKFNSNMSQALFSTFLGIPIMNYWSGEAIAVSAQGDIAITGEIDGANSFPLQNPLLELDDPNYDITNQSRDGYVVKWLNTSAGYRVDYATLWGGGGRGLAIDMKGRNEVLVGGYVNPNPYLDPTYHYQDGPMPGDSVGPHVISMKNDVADTGTPGNGGGGSGAGGGASGDGGGGGPVSPHGLLVLLALLIRRKTLDKESARPCRQASAAVRR